MPRKIVYRFATLLCVLAILPGLPGGALGQGPKPKNGLKLPKLLTTRPLDPAGESDEIRRLLRARYNAVLEEVRGRWQQFQTGSSKLDPLLESLRRLRSSGVEVEAIGRNRLQFLEDYVAMTRQVEDLVQRAVKAGQLASADAAQARYMRLDAEVELLRARLELAGPKGTPGR
jgi:hypothetical protein